MPCLYIATTLNMSQAIKLVIIIIIIIIPYVTYLPFGLIRTLTELSLCYSL